MQILEAFNSRILGKSNLEIDLSQVRGGVDMSPEQAGALLREQIEKAKPGALIWPPPGHIVVEEMLITKNIHVQGSPGTVIEVTKGSIYVNNPRPEERVIFSECEFVLGSSLSVSQIDPLFPEMAVEEDKTNLEPLTTGAPRSSFRHNPISVEDDPPVRRALFIVENLSVLELHDCVLKREPSVEDAGNSKVGAPGYTVQDAPSPQRAAGVSARVGSLSEESKIKERACARKQTQLSSAAVVLNLRGGPFRGAAYFLSTTFQGFSSAVYAGQESILYMEKCVCTGMSSTAILSQNPEKLSLVETLVEQCDGHSVHILWSPE